MGLIAGATALLVPGDGPPATRVLAYFDVNAALIAAVWIVTVLATARMARRRPWDAAMVAVAPGIVLAGTINWDMWAVALLALGMYFFSRNKLVLAGIFIGLGTATKLYPLLILGAVLLLALRTGASGPCWSPPAPPPQPGWPSTSRWPPLIRTAGSTSTSSPRSGPPATARPGSPTTSWPAGWAGCRWRPKPSTPWH